MTDDPSLRENAENLHDELDTEKVDVTVDYLEEQFEKYAQYDVTGDDARASIIDSLADEYDLEDLGDALDGDQSNEDVMVEDLEEDQFVNVEVVVDQLWDNDNDSISQTGLVYDDTGKVKFTSWEKSELPILTEGTAYRLENVATSEWNGRMQIGLNSSTEVEMIDAEFEEPSNTESFEGYLVDVYGGSGLIQRCTATEDCSRVLSKGECREHGNVDGEFDLRIKGVVDNGLETQRVIIGREITEEISGMTMQEAREIFEDALDPEVVVAELRERVIFTRFKFQGFVNDGDDMIVQEAEEQMGVDEDDVEELMLEVDALQPADVQTMVNDNE